MEAQLVESLLDLSRISAGKLKLAMEPLFIHRDTPDVLVSDIAMPQEDGYAMIRKLRAAEREQQRKHLPAIALTAYASPSDREQALLAGYDQHLAKPVHQRELTRAIAKIFNDQRTSALHRHAHQAL